MIRTASSTLALKRIRLTGVVEVGQTTCSNRVQRQIRQRGFASVSPPSLADLIDGNSSFSSPSDPRLTPAQRARHLNPNAPPRASGSDDAKPSNVIVKAKQERKLAEYAAKLKEQAMREGFGSVEELRAHRLASVAAASAAASELEAKASQAMAGSAASSDPPASETIRQRDARVAAEIGRRSEAEAKRKIATGEVMSGANGQQKSPVKPLSSILDLERLVDQPAHVIGDLWTKYHAMNNKLSAAIPVSTYEQLVATARDHPQFVVPLPRKVVDEDAPTAAEKEGFEMQYLQWGFLPPPALTDVKAAASTSEIPAVKKPLPAPTTVLFTPLALYKLRQEWAEPLLILTHYVELAHTKGIVLMRGEVTGANEETGVSTRLSQSDAQLLTMALQRFYLAPAKCATPGATTDDAERRRASLLKTFHEDPEKFDVAALVQTAFQI